MKEWTRTGNAFNNQPTYGDNPHVRRNPPVTSNHEGNYWIGTYENRPTPDSPAGKWQGDQPIGTLTSPTFVIHGAVVSFLVAGGCFGKTGERVELIVNNTVVRSYMTAACSETMKRQSWNVSELINKMARLRMVDGSSSSWGHINFDDFREHLDPCTGKCIALVFVFFIQKITLEQLKMLLLTTILYKESFGLHSHVMN